MVCLTQRPDSTFDSAEHQQMLKRHEIARELTLSRLTRDEVKQWLEAAFHGQQAGRESWRFSTATPKVIRCSSPSCSARSSKTARSVQRKPLGVDASLRVAFAGRPAALIAQR
jgi:hypothetical protein